MKLIGVSFMRRKINNNSESNNQNQNKSTGNPNKAPKIPSRKIPINKAKASMFLSWRQDNAAFSEPTPEYIARFIDQDE